MGGNRDLRSVSCFLIGFSVFALVLHGFFKDMGVFFFFFLGFLGVCFLFVASQGLGSSCGLSGCQVLFGGGF